MSFTVKQLYDENGKPYYPITSLNQITGDTSKLSSVSEKVNNIDLSGYLAYRGFLSVCIINNLIYSYDGTITITSGNMGEDIIVAENIPEKYRKKKQRIPLSISKDFNNSIAYIDPNGSLIIRITPTEIYDGKNTDLSNSDFFTVYINGLFLKSKMEE